MQEYFAYIVLMIVIMSQGDCHTYNLLQLKKPIILALLTHDVSWWFYHKCCGDIRCGLAEIRAYKKSNGFDDNASTFSKFFIWTCKLSNTFWT